MARRQANVGKKEQAAVNRAKALALRIRGMAGPAIAAELHVTRRAAARYVQTALRQLAALQERQAEELRNLERARLDALTEALTPKALKGDAKSALALIRVMERRAKLLGLDAPEQHDHRVVAALAVQTEVTKLREMTTEELLEINRAYLEEVHS